MNKQSTSLLITGFLQVYFVATNVFFISVQNLIGVAVSGFMISLIWSYNVKKIAFGSRLDRLYYALGASLGSILGALTASAIGG